MSFFQKFKRGKKVSSNRKKALKQVMFGCSLAGSNQHDDAIPLFQQAIETDPNCAEAYYALGLMYSKKGMNEEATVQYNKAIEINPDYKEKIASFDTAQEDDDNFDIVKELKKNL